MISIPQSAVAAGKQTQDVSVLRDQSNDTTGLDSSPTNRAQLAQECENVRVPAPSTAMDGDTRIARKRE